MSLVTLFDSGTLPHAVLLEADQAVATHVVAELRDQFQLSAADYWETGTPLKITDARQVRRFVAKTRFGSSVKLVFIPEAHLMTHEAANALLKTLEEPPKGTYLILATVHVEDLLPTIRSRCQLIRYPSSRSKPTVQPPLTFSQLSEAFATAKELAASEMSLSDYLSTWLQSLHQQKDLGSIQKESVILDYLAIAEANPNRRLFLDNFFLDLYNMKHELRIKN